MRIRFNETVGILLIINSAILVIVMVFRKGERNSQLFYSKLRNIGIITSSASAGVGASVKNGVAYDGFSLEVLVLKRVRCSAQQIAKSSAIAQPRSCRFDNVHK